MKKEKIEYSCRSCGQIYQQWVGKCKVCEEWNSLEERNFVTKNQKLSTLAITFDSLPLITDSLPESNNYRYTTDILELDRVLGGGLVEGTAILLSGEPGIGKSTLLLQVCNALAKKNLQIAYISGEESLLQIATRAKRMSINGSIKLINTSNLEEVVSLIQSMKKPGIAVIDSIQTLGSSSGDGAVGTISQVKFCTFELVKLAKTVGISLIIVGHVNKEGQIAGPKLLEHMVDVVLSFEADNSKQYRIIRGLKNRYGSTNEIGIFEMSGMGLLEVGNPSKLFMPNKVHNTSGACIFAGLEGTRGLLVEVQALVAPAYIPTPRRGAIGWDNNRLSMILAILNARLKCNLTDKEVYLNVAGGTKITDPGLDLPVLVALISAYKNIPIDSDTAFVGEIGLLGEIRAVAHLDLRLKEAATLGFKTLVTAVPDKMKLDNDKIKVVKVNHIRELVPLFFSS
jgi:DNA repair protein RadA/Sms